jgi:hypothetical protein
MRYPHLAIAAGVTFFAAIFASESQASDVDDAIRVVVTFCLSGGTITDTHLTLDPQGNKIESSAGEAKVKIETHEAVGFANGLSAALTQLSARQGSEARRCMEPYIRDVLNMIQRTPGATLSGKVPPADSSSVVCDERNGGECRPYVDGNSHVCFADKVISGLLQEKRKSCRFTVFVRSQNSADEWNWRASVTRQTTQLTGQLVCLDAMPFQKVEDIRARIVCE